MVVLVHSHVLGRHCHCCCQVTYDLLLSPIPFFGVQVQTDTPESSCHQRQMERNHQGCTDCWIWRKRCSEDWSSLCFLLGQNAERMNFVHQKLLLWLFCVPLVQCEFWSHLWHSHGCDCYQYNIPLGVCSGQCIPLIPPCYKEKNKAVVINNYIQYNCNSWPAAKDNKTERKRPETEIQTERRTDRWHRTNKLFAWSSSQLKELTLD